eukprot:5090056-Pyramimonas_sp.AAC.2
MSGLPPQCPPKPHSSGSLTSGLVVRGSIPQAVVMRKVAEQPKLRKDAAIMALAALGAGDLPCSIALVNPTPEGVYPATCRCPACIRLFRASQTV